jgi:hypothetical protein
MFHSLYYWKTSVPEEKKKDTEIEVGEGGNLNSGSFEVEREEKDPTGKVSGSA